MESILFKNHISEVIVLPKKRVSNWQIGYVITTGKRATSEKRFGIFTKYERIKGVFNHNGLFETDRFECTIEEYNETRERYYIEDDVFYAKPYCVIKMDNGSQHRQDFQTIDELNVFVKSLQQIGTHIIIK